MDKQKQAYENGWNDGWKAAHDSYQEHESRIYAVAFASGMKAGNWKALQEDNTDGWADQ